MQHIKTVIGKVLAATKLPPQLQPGVSTVELIGRTTAVISHHRGLAEYTAQRICADSREGIIAVTGSGLTITEMDAASLTISGKITGVSYAEGQT